MSVEWSVVESAVVRDDVIAFENAIPEVDERRLLSAVFVVVCMGAHRILEWWIHHGLDLERGSNQGPLVYSAAAAGQAEVLRVLLRHGAPKTGVPLVAAANSGSLECVRALVEAGVDPNQGYAGFPTALGAATNRGFVEMAEYLRAQGATKLVGDDSGVGV
jgi:ankyrin repeat protein